MEIDFDFGKYNLWDLTGPIMIPAVIVLIVGLVLLMFMSRIKNDLVRQLVATLAIFLILIIFLYATIAVSGIWSQR